MCVPSDLIITTHFLSLGVCLISKSWREEYIGMELDHFPRLEKGGGYELLRSSGKDLPAVGYSAEYLKSSAM